MFAPGAVRGLRGARPDRRQRLQYMKLRHTKICCIHRNLPRCRSRTDRIYMIGVRPAALFGADANGVFDSELRFLRRILNSARTPGHGGPSTICRFVAHGGPAWKHAIVPALQWARASWQSILQPGSASFSSHQLLSLTMSRARFGRPQRVESPLRHIGWKSVLCFQWENDIVRAHHLAEHNLNVMGCGLQEANRRFRERLIALWSGPCFLVRMAGLDLVRKQGLRPSRVCDARGGFVTLSQRAVGFGLRTGLLSAVM